MFCTIDFPKVVGRFYISSLRLSQNKIGADLFISHDGTKSSVKMAVVRLFVLALFVLSLLYISNRLLKLHVNLKCVFHTNKSKLDFGSTTAEKICRRRHAARKKVGCSVEKEQWQQAKIWVTPFSQR